MDLSKLSDADLLALKSGDLTKVSDAGLVALKAPEAPQAAPEKPTPPTTSVALNAASKGIAGLPDAVLNAPNRIVNLGKAAFGTAATALGRPDLAPELTPDPNYAHRAVKAFGAIRDANEPATPTQRVIDTMVQGAVGTAINPASGVRQMAGNLATGALGGGAAGVTSEATESPEAAMLAGAMAPGAVQAAGRVGRNRVAEAVARRQQNETNDQTLAHGRAAGYVVSPSEVNPSLINRTLESLAGKDATKQEASLRNQNVTNRLAAEEVGLPPNAAITEGRLNAVRGRESAPYREIAALSPRADAALFQLREARQQANLHYRHYERSADPNALANYKALETRAAMLERVIDREARRAGRPGLVDELREARAALAKTHDVERSLNLGNSDVSARSLGSALDRGAPLSGNLETTARFQQAFPNVMRDAATTPAPGVSKLGAYMGGLMGIGGASLAGPAGAAAAFAPLASTPLRSAILSRPYQRAFATPRYNQGRILSQIPEQDAALQAALIARAVADRQGER